MTFTTTLLDAISSKHLLKHPFYQAWTDGSLACETIQKYARHYFKHVSAFPRYVSATHSNCESLEARQVLLENLIDEERGEGHHPGLWMEFAQGMGNSREAVEGEVSCKSINEVIDTFMSLSRSSYAEGLGALFAYESQVPEVAKFKLDALEKHYAVKPTDRTGEFFRVHATADVYHTQALTGLLEQLTPADQERAKQAAIQASGALWGFLDEMNQDVQCESHAS